jgi:two-component system phosphate regulon sensor histidine kinase PhoR
MTGLVDNLLLLARLDQPVEAVASILHPEEIHPFPLLEEVYERSLLLVKDQQVELVWPKSEISPFWADREMIRRALNNIVENAINYTPAGKKIALSLENQNGYCCFIIEDQGIGIAPDQLPKITERFYRGDESRNRMISGSGLGLAIVAAIVRVHEGKIQVESEPNQGTRFRLLFKQMVPPS